MSLPLHSLLPAQARERPDKIALEYREEKISYHSLNTACERFAGGCLRVGLSRGARVGVYLPRCIEAVAAFFGALHAGACLVPINPALKSRQAGHILEDCGVELLVTTSSRLSALHEARLHNPELQTVVVIDQDSVPPGDPDQAVHTEGWQEFCAQPAPAREDLNDADLAAIFYTSGSTGLPKGVMLTHKNLCAGVESVTAYLENTSKDRVLSVLPFSFDYGFSQLSTAFSVGATVVILDYLLPQDIPKAIERDRITGLAGVPALWQQLARLEWTKAAGAMLRYITSSGDVLPETAVRMLAEKLPTTDIYLMYGFTEAFRSTYLPPQEIRHRPTSIGKAIPGAWVQAVREDGSPCDPDEVGELVHGGPLVAEGYWNHSVETEERFRPLASDSAGAGEIVAWSGDLVRQDREGYFYFVGRKDDMIKTSGYRVSPAEIEGPACQHDVVREAVAFGVAHLQRGQSIVLTCTTDQDPEEAQTALDQHLKDVLPLYMVPDRYIWTDAIPCNDNGKFDRKRLARRYQADKAET